MQMSDDVLHRGLQLARSEVNPVLRSKLLMPYVISFGPGEMRNELLSEVYDSVEQIHPMARGQALWDVTMALVYAGILRED